MKVIIAGAGSVGRSIAKELVQSGHDITIIDRHPSAMKVASVPEAEWQLDDACELTSLQRANLDEADVVVATTGDDKVNLVVSLLAKTEFGVERVIARVNNPKNEWLFDESWGVDVAVSTPRVIAPYVEDAVANGRLATVMHFHRSGAALLQTTLPPKAPIVGLAVSDVVLPPSIVLNAIVRDGVPFTAEPDLTVEAGDQVLFLRSAESSSATTPRSSRSSLRSRSPAAVSPRFGRLRFRPPSALASPFGCARRPAGQPRSSASAGCRPGPAADDSAAGGSARTAIHVAQAARAKSGRPMTSLLTARAVVASVK